MLIGQEQCVTVTNESAGNSVVYSVPEYKEVERVGAIVRSLFAPILSLSEISFV